MAHFVRRINGKMLIHKQSEITFEFLKYVSTSVKINIARLFYVVQTITMEVSWTIFLKWNSKHTLSFFVEINIGKSTISEMCNKILVTNSLRNCANNNLITPSRFLCKILFNTFYAF